ncbi:MAG: outer membrane beta-barrel protein [Prevotella sp.]|nr:outer membrane beta-barrel protein [Prevotella sp.]
MTNLSLRTKLAALSFFIFSLSFSPAEAQVRFGVKGGFQLASMEFSSDALDKTNRVGYCVGPVLKIGLPISGVSIETSVLYDRRDLKIQDETFKQQSLLLQGDFSCGAGIGDFLGIFVKLGPQFSFNVGDDLLHWATERGDENHFSLQETMLSLNLGAGITFASHFEGAITYNVPISKTADFTWTQLTDELATQTWNHAKTRTNAWNVTLTYFF